MTTLGWCPAAAWKVTQVWGSTAKDAENKQFCHCTNQWFSHITGTVSSIGGLISEKYGKKRWVLKNGLRHSQEINIFHMSSVWVVWEEKEYKSEDNMTEVKLWVPWVRMIEVNCSLSFSSRIGDHHANPGKMLIQNQKIQIFSFNWFQPWQWICKKESYRPPWGDWAGFCWWPTK